MKKLLTFLMATSCSILVFGQDHTTHSAQHGEHEEAIKHHRLAIEFGYAHIPDGYEEQPGDQPVWVPTLGLDYSYRFNHKWAIATTANIELGNYLIEFNREDLNREYVFIFAVLGVYDILPNWAIFAGPGIELEHHQNFGLVRIGTDYSVALKNNWDITPTFSLDHKIDYYSYEFVISIGKRF